MFYDKLLKIIIIIIVFIKRQNHESLRIGNDHQKIVFIVDFFSSMGLVEIYDSRTTFYLSARKIFKVLFSKYYSQFFFQEAISKFLSSLFGWCHSNSPFRFLSWKELKKQQAPAKIAQILFPVWNETCFWSDVREKKDAFLYGTLVHDEKRRILIGFLKVGMSQYGLQRKTAYEVLSPNCVLKNIVQKWKKKQFIVKLTSFSFTCGEQLWSNFSFAENGCIYLSALFLKKAL